jgi:uncharacterized protein
MRHTKYARSLTYVGLVGVIGSSKIPKAARQLVEQQKLGFVASVCQDGSPNVSPKGTVSIWDENHMVFADLDSPGTVANLLRDPRVEVNVVDPLLRKGWRFKGVAEVLRTGPRFDQGVRFFDKANILDAPRRIRSIVIIQVQRVAPLISPAYSTGLTESEILDRSWKRCKRIYEARSGKQTDEPRRDLNPME